MGKFHLSATLAFVAMATSQLHAHHGDGAMHDASHSGSFMYFALALAIPGLGYFLSPQKWFKK